MGGPSQPGNVVRGYLIKRSGYLVHECDGKVRWVELWKLQGVVRLGLGLGLGSNSGNSKAPSTTLQGIPGGNDTWATAPPNLGTLGAAPKPDPTSSAPTPFVLQPDGSILDARELL